MRGLPAFSEMPMVQWLVKNRPDKRYNTEPLEKKQNAHAPCGFYAASKSTQTCIRRSEEGLNGSLVQRLSISFDWYTNE